MNSIQTDVHCKTRCKGTLAPWFVFIHLALHIFLKDLFLINFSLKTKSATHLYVVHPIYLILPAD